jgi:hypothetical protein
MCTSAIRYPLMYNPALALVIIHIHCYHCSSIFTHYDAMRTSVTYISRCYSLNSSRSRSSFVLLQVVITRFILVTRSRISAVLQYGTRFVFVSCFVTSSTFDVRRSIYEVPMILCFFWFGRKVAFACDSGSLNVDKGSTNYTLGRFDLMYRQSLSIGDKRAFNDAQCIY